MNSSKPVLLFLLLLSLSLFAQPVRLNIPPADNKSFRGKVMFGYQGWFAHPNDNSPRPHYWHWGNLSTTDPSKLHVEMYPDLREFGKKEKYATGYSFANGKRAPVFSSGNRETVIRHMKWVRDYNTDGVFLQRFISEYGDRVVWRFRDSVTAAIKEGCEKYQRLWAIMWDGVGHKDAVANIKADWKNLVDNMGILNKSAYLRHDGLPLIALWGYTFYNDATVSELEALLDWFQKSAPSKYRAKVMLGLNDNWFNKSSSWRNAFGKAQVISPWSVGRYRNQSGYNTYRTNQINPGKSWCDSRRILYVPVIWPGFSWYNLKGRTTPKNEIPRQGGNFYWMQSHGAVTAGNPTIYIAMFDELDEATSMFKTAERASQSPAQGYWLNLNADGKSLPSDWFLRCAGKTAQVIRGTINASSSLGTPPPGIMTIRPKDNEGLSPNGSMDFIFPNFNNKDAIEISIDGGKTYPYTTPDNVGTFKISRLGGGTYNVFVRHDSQSPAVDMGPVYIDGPSRAITTPHRNSSSPVTITYASSPFKNSAKIVFTLSSASKVTVMIYDLSGQKIKTLLNQNINPGQHRVYWDGNNDNNTPTSSGLYTCIITTTAGSFTRNICKFKG